MIFQDILKYSKDLNVLYVEDDEELLAETQEALEDFFSFVDTATDGSLALEKYLNYHAKNKHHYDLIITDINMPVMSGVELIKEVHKIDPEQVVMVISAYNDSKRLIELINIGVTYFIMKPIAPTQLMNILYQATKQISNHKELIEYRRELEDVNRYLDEKVKEQAKEIIYTQQISIEAIANMVESYDDDTGTHVKRIEQYTQRIVSLLPISKDNPQEHVASIPFASILHDIGKLMIPKEILTKPAPLTDNETVIIKTHAKLGGEVLKKANVSFKGIFNKDSYLKTASDIAMYHHEKWDGTGYPDGLKGSAIPKSARVVAIVDVYDALRSKRVYKDGFTHDRAVEIISNEREKSFDPELIDIFLSIHEDFDEIFNRLT
ncbi:MAG: response regulator [Campylobacterota bacterium]|nr:response regulator [Campylobacterota bacterium]